MEIILILAVAVVTALVADVIVDFVTKREPKWQCIKWLFPDKATLDRMYNDR